MEKTFVIIKPDGVKRRLVGEIISRFEKKGLYLVQTKVCIPTDEILAKHYAAHAGKKFFKDLVEFMKSGQVVCMVWEGTNVVKTVRDLMGATNSDNAMRGTIRGDFAMSICNNIVHGSDSVEAANNEIKIWFGDDIPTIKHFDRDIIYE